MMVFAEPVSPTFKPALELSKALACSCIDMLNTDFKGHRSSSDTNIPRCDVDLDHWAGALRTNSALIVVAKLSDTFRIGTRTTGGPSTPCVVEPALYFETVAAVASVMPRMFRIADKINRATGRSARSYGPAGDRCSR
jgi:hypothetical protein